MLALMKASHRPMAHDSDSESDSDSEEEVAQCINDSGTFVVMDLEAEDLIVERPEKKEAGCACVNPILRRERTQVVCTSCGHLSENTENTLNESFSVSSNNCNVSSNSSVAIRAVGKGSYRMQKAFFKSIADYSKQRRADLMRMVVKWDDTATRNNIPKVVIRAAVSMFIKINEAKRVYRNEGKKGVLSACLYYACYMNNTTKTPSEIAAFSGIMEKYHSRGDRELHSLCEQGIIEIPTNIDPILHYVKRYMYILSIDPMYMPFVLDIIERAERNFIHIRYNSRNNSKCVGAIWMLINRVEELREKITKEQVEKSCEISKTTFIRYYNDVLRRFPKLLRKSFVQHRIPMEYEWQLIFDESDARRAARRRYAKLAVHERTEADTVVPCSPVIRGVSKHCSELHGAVGARWEAEDLAASKPISSAERRAGRVAHLAARALGRSHVYLQGSAEASKKKIAAKKPVRHDLIAMGLATQHKDKAPEFAACEPVMTADGSTMTVIEPEQAGVMVSIKLAPMTKADRLANRIAKVRAKNLARGG